MPHIAPVRMTHRLHAYGLPAPSKAFRDRYVENPPEDWVECGCCGGYHPADYPGDCRDDAWRRPFSPARKED